MMFLIFHARLKIKINMNILIVDGNEKDASDRYTKWEWILNLKYMKKY